MPVVCRSGRTPWRGARPRLPAYAREPPRKYSASTRVGRLGARDVVARSLDARPGWKVLVGGDDVLIRPQAACRGSGGRRGRAPGPPWVRSRGRGERSRRGCCQRLDRIGAEPAPDRRARDRGGDALLDGGAGQSSGHCQRASGWGLLGLRREFAGQRLDGDHDVRGKLGAAPPEADRSVRPDAGRRSARAIWRRLAAARLGDAAISSMPRPSAA